MFLIYIIKDTTNDVLEEVTSVPGEDKPQRSGTIMNDHDIFVPKKSWDSPLPSNA